MPQISINNLNIKYINKKIETQVINDMSCEFEDGKISVIIGESGSGKTSLFKAIIGLIDYEGDIIVDGVDYMNLEIKEKNLAYVSQEFALYPNMTVFQNIAFPLTLTNASSDEIRNRVNEVAKMLKIDFLLTRKPKQISIGQQQRVAIARAMIKRPNIYLFDEIFSNLDEKTGTELRIELKKILKSLNATALFVTHHSVEAMALADKLFIIDQGQIVASGTPLEVFDIKDPSIHAFFEDIENAI